MTFRAKPLRSSHRQLRSPCRAEGLERRVLMSTYTVTGLGDSAGSVRARRSGAFTATTLRAALNAANAHRGADVIAFARSVAGTIPLGRALPHVRDTLTITGPGPSRLTIARRSDADGLFSVLTVDAGVTAAVSGPDDLRRPGDAAAGPRRPRRRRHLQRREPDRPQCGAIGQFGGVRRRGVQR